ncbi:MAG: response regulator [Thermodesulfobacteriota bacterium]|nr:response regulator [Thermodesulfobacteriota bacterium]
MANILVVDDEESIRELIQEILKMDLHNVDVANNGASGLKKFKDNAYDLVITDLIMPEKDGIEFINELKASHSGVKILAISGGSWGIDAAPQLEIAGYLGASSSLEKPFEMEELVAAVNRLLL